MPPPAAPPSLPNLPSLPSTEVDVAAVVADATHGEWGTSRRTTARRAWRRPIVGSDHVEVRVNGVLSAPPGVVLALLRSHDDDVVKSYAPRYESGRVLERYGGWNRGEPVRDHVFYARYKGDWPYKPRETVTRISEHSLGSVGRGALPGGVLPGGTLRLMRPTEHAEAPERPNEVVRARLHGVQLVIPVPGQPRWTNLTSVMFVEAGGQLPPKVVDAAAADDAVNLIGRVAETAGWTDRWGSEWAAAAVVGFAAAAAVGRAAPPPRRGTCRAPRAA